MSYDKESLNTLQIWTRFPGLYEGERKLENNDEMLGVMKRFDVTTTNKARGMFTRVLIEMNLLMIFLMQYNLRINKVTWCLILFYVTGNQLGVRSVSSLGIWKNNVNGLCHITTNKMLL